MNREVVTQKGVGYEQGGSNTEGVLGMNREVVTQKGVGYEQGGSNTEGCWV